MHTKHIAYLACPGCSSPLTLHEEADCTTGQVEHGFLLCAHCREMYPIIKGIPRFVSSENYAASFGYEWNMHATTQYESKGGGEDSRKRFVAETQWPSDLIGEVILEVGCGAGRFTEQALKTGAMVCAVDYSNAVDANYRQHGANENVLIAQADIYHLPFKKGAFDRVFCLGVLQHLPDVKKGFDCLLPPLKPGGHLAVDVYAKMRGVVPFILRSTQARNWLRLITPSLKPEHLYGYCRRYITIMYPFARWMSRFPLVAPFILRRFVIPPYFGVYDLPEGRLREWMILDLFDGLSARYENCQYIDVVEKWLRQAPLKDVTVCYGYNGINGRGVRL